MKKDYQKSEELKQLAEKVIKEKHLTELQDSDSKFEYLLVYPYITKTKAGRCSKVKENMKFLTELDYVIEMSGQIWDVLSDDVKEILVHHELLHAHPVYNEKKETGTYRLRDHNVKDFHQLINKHGLDWLTTLKTSASSVYDLSPEQEDNLII